MKSIFRILSILGIATLISGVPQAVGAQQSPSPTPRTRIQIPEELQEVEINEFNQGDRVNSIYAPAYGAPAHPYRFQPLPEGIGGSDLEIEQRVYVIELGDRQIRQPNYREGDNLVQIQLTNF